MFCIRSEGTRGQARCRARGEEIETADALNYVSCGWADCYIWALQPVNSSIAQGSRLVECQGCAIDCWHDLRDEELQRTNERAS